MRFLNGVMIGSLLTASAVFLYAGSVDESKRKLVRKGKQFARKIGV